MAVGAYQTACEISPNKQQIDQWLNENKSCEWINRELKNKYRESISSVSIRKYKKYREEWIQKEIEKDPLYQSKTKEIREQFNDNIGKIRKIDVIGKLSDIIDDTSSYLIDAKNDENVKIRSMQDYKFVASTMLDAIKLYGDTILKAQRFDAVDKDPTLLKPTTINVNVKTALTNILGEIIDDNGYNLIDQLRSNDIIDNNNDNNDEIIDIEI